MEILHDISLKPFNTFGIDVKAKHFVSIANVDELKQVLDIKTYSNRLLLGGGSNMLLTKDVEALVIHLNMKGIAIISEYNEFVYVNANA